MVIAVWGLVQVGREAPQSRSTGKLCSECVKCDERPLLVCMVCLYEDMDHTIVDYLAVERVQSK